MSSWLLLWRHVFFKYKTYMKKTLLSLFGTVLIATNASGQGWPAYYDGVMLQGFYWDSFTDSKWKNLEAQADEISMYFDLMWVPQSGKAQYSPSMGYDVLYYWNQNSSFGTEEQLRSMIKAYKDRGTGVIADVVVNHRGNVSSWVDFPKETYKGVTYEMTSTDIVANDDGGATKTWADQNGFKLSQNNDDGEGWDGMRDLDHKSANVQKSVKAYTKYLLDDLGYTGFRYDMVKGFGGEYVAQYNVNAGVKYSVGEYWDGNPSVVKTWINKTKVNGVPQSAAFDFPFRYTCRDAANGDWSKLKNASLASDADYRQYSVTFIENHDTEKRANANQDPIKKDTLALNAWLLTMPGTPCVFLKHWKDCKEDIKNMIEIRRMAGITNTSTYSDFASKTEYCVRKVKGATCQVAVAVGNYKSAVGTGFQEVISGKNYRLFVEKSLKSVWFGTPSGVWEQGQKVKTTLTAISDVACKIVYTTDGTEPTATNGKTVDSGTEIELSSTSTVKAGLLIDGKVTGVQERKYIFKEAGPAYEAWDLNIYVRTYVNDFKNRMNFYIWAGDDNEQVNGNWPGKQITETVEQGGYKWFKQTIRITKEELLPVNVVFSTGTGSPQSVDVTGITAEAWFVIESTKDGNKYKVTDVTSQYTSLEDIFANPAAGTVYDLLGREVKSPQKGLFYIHNGRKVIINGL